MNDLRDQLYTHIEGTLGSFRFDKQVAKVFNDMIRRSVPGYSQIISLLPTLTRQHRFDGANYYDLGCSTGAGLLAMADGLEGIDAQLIGLDNSAAMIEQASTFTKPIVEQSNLELNLYEADICQFDYHQAGMMLMNFTLQFIALEQRDALISKLFDALLPSGLLVLSEKVHTPDPAVQELLTRVHHQYKADQGYSQLEISNKRDAIENVLIPEPLETHTSRLRAAGFRTVTPWIRNLQFVSILAVK